MAGNDNPSLVHRRRGTEAQGAPERSPDDLPSRSYPALTNDQVSQIRELIKERRGYKELGSQGYAFSIFFVILISAAVAGIAWNRIGNLETNLMSKTVDIGFDVILTIVENNPELLGEDKVAGLLHIAERHIQQAFDEDISGRIGNLLFTTSENLILEGDKSRYKMQNIRALTLYKLSYEVFKNEKPANDEVARRIGSTTAQLSAAVQPLVQAGGALRETAIKYGVNYMEGLLKELHLMKDVTPSVKALAVGRCSVDLVNTMSEIGELERAIHIADEGIAIMENEYREEASRYQYYGYLLNNQGAVYEAKKEFKNAAMSYAKALEAKLKAVDYESEENKNADLALTKNNLARAQSNAPDSQK